MSKIDVSLLQKIRAGLAKQAFVQMGPEGAQTPPPQDPNMQGPPMTPPGGAPGMDPAAAGGAPPGADPSTAGVPGSGQPVMLQMQDLMQLVQMIGSGGAGGGGAGGASGGGTGGGGKGGGAKELAAKVDSIANDIAQLKAFVMGTQAGASPTPIGSPVSPDSAPPPPMMPGQPPGMPPGMPSGVDPAMMGMDPAMAQGGGMPPGGGGMPPGGMQVQGSVYRQHAANVPPMPRAQVLSGIIGRLTR